MSFKQISALEAKDLIGDFPHDQMTTYIIPDPIDSRLGPEKLKEKAEAVIKRDIGFGESFFLSPYG